MDQRGRPSAAGFLAVDGGNLYYEVEGEGAALVLIHGWLGNLRMWDFQAQALAGSYRVVRCDMRGSAAARPSMSSSPIGRMSPHSSTTSVLIGLTSSAIRSAGR